MNALAIGGSCPQNCSDTIPKPQREDEPPPLLIGLVAAVARGTWFLAESLGVSSPSGSIAVHHADGAPARAVDPVRNPSYPERTHYHERPALEETLRNCEQRLKSLGQKLAATANHPQKASFALLYQQMQGALDQVAEAVRRMPLETGSLYHEDQERLTQALAAFDRIERKWQALS